jgi:putative transposase
MMKNHCLAQALQDASFFEINRQFDYKASWYGRTIHRLSRWFPSSKTCSKCGWINQNLKLKDRTWQCVCGAKHDRDVNASHMILQQGLKEITIPQEVRELKRGDSQTNLTELSVGVRMNHEAPTL